MLNMQKDKGIITSTPTPQKNEKHKPIETGEADEPTIISVFCTPLQSVSFLCHDKIPELAYKERRFALAHSFHSFSLWSLDSLLWGLWWAEWQSENSRRLCFLLHCCWKQRQTGQGRTSSSPSEAHPWLDFLQQGCTDSQVPQPPNSCIGWGASLQHMVLWGHWKPNYYRDSWLAHLIGTHGAATCNEITYCRQRFLSCLILQPFSPNKHTKAYMNYKLVGLLAHANY